MCIAFLFKMSQRSFSTTCFLSLWVASSRFQDSIEITNYWYVRSPMGLVGICSYVRKSFAVSELESEAQQQVALCFSRYFFWLWLYGFWSTCCVWDAEMATRYNLYFLIYFFLFIVICCRCWIVAGFWAADF